MAISPNSVEIKGLHNKRRLGFDMNHTVLSTCENMEIEHDCTLRVHGVSVLSGQRWLTWH